MNSPYLIVEQAANYLRVSKNYLDKLRVSGTGPPFVRLGRRKVLYRKSDLDKWVEERIYASTTQYGS
ncbi:helix-turn-helix domain-containing protein [Mesorhizobium sp. VNQ89]|uniref:helix-turn-helix transcriptional regulator n=1 Tax=Mesorhizobium quangtriensis TaxID=3157709 RepID=UPI0032B78A13